MKRTPKSSAVLKLVIRKPKTRAARFSQEQLGKAFDMVKNPKGWKFPIKAVIDNPGKKNLACLEEAISHFTGGFATITELKNGKLRVKAQGYYACIGG